VHEGDFAVSVDDYSSVIGGIETGKSLTFLKLAGFWLADGSYGHTHISFSTGNDKDLVSFLKEAARLLYKPKPSHLIIQKVLAGEMEGQTKCKFARKNSEEMGVSIGATYDALRDIERIKQIPWEYTVSHKNKGDYRLYSKALKDELVDFGCIGDCYTKTIPKALFTATKEEIAAFLCGYFSGDGSVPNLKTRDPVISASSVNRELLEGIRVLLNRLGIVATIGIDPSITGFRTKRTQYKLVICRRESQKSFMKKVGFLRWIEPRMVEAIKKNKPKRHHRTTLRKVISVEPVGVKRVYDISVPNKERFIAGGFLCHNSGSAVWRK
jgi:intein/homing endonuclease